MAYAETSNIHIPPDRRKEVHEEQKVYEDQELIENIMNKVFNERELGEGTTTL
jgi:hypothetical protein